MTQAHKHVQVVIVGAGPTGLALGNLLGMAGIETIILERNAGLSCHPKAIAIDDEGLRICQSLGLGTALMEHMLLDLEAHYLSGKQYLAKVSLSRRRNGYPFISTFHQPAFETILMDGLKRFPCVTILFQHTAESFTQNDAGVIVHAHKNEVEDRREASCLKQHSSVEEKSLVIECAYLLACDGSKSAIRHALGIKMHGSIAPQKWLVVDCLSEKDAPPVVTFYCNPQRPAVNVPAPAPFSYPDYEAEGMRDEKVVPAATRWEFMLLPGEKEEEMLREETIRGLIEQTGQWRVVQILRRAIYTFYASRATTFSKGRVFLLGDAAHLMPPFGGQGMNSGLRDAANLSWKLDLVLKGLASSSLLDTYTEERIVHVEQMIDFSLFLASMIMTTAHSVALARDIAFRALNAIPVVRKFFAQGRPKPEPRYKRGFLLFDSSEESKSITGYLLPQPEVITADGRQVLLDEVLGPGFALLRLTKNPGEKVAGMKDEIWKRLGVRLVCVVPLESAGNSREAVDCEGRFIVSEQQQELVNFLRHNSKICVLVRPDRYVFGIFREEQAQNFISAFQKSLVLHSESDPGVVDVECRSLHATL